MAISHLHLISSLCPALSVVLIMFLSVSLVRDVYKRARFISSARPFRSPNVKETCPKPFSTVNQHIKQQPERIRKVSAGGRSGVWKFNGNG